MCRIHSGRTSSLSKANLDLLSKTILSKINLFVRSIEDPENKGLEGKAAHLYSELETALMLRRVYFLHDLTSATTRMARRVT